MTSKLRIALAVAMMIATFSNSATSFQLEPYETDEEVYLADQKQAERVTEYPNGVNVIPGEAELDYPVYHTAPKTAFTCEGRLAGFYADVETRCQAWHTCDVDARMQTFLCPNGTIYSQTKRVCEWWYNVNCDPYEVNRNYDQNRELYVIPKDKVIIQEVEGTNNKQDVQKKNSHTPQIQQQQQQQQQQYQPQPIRQDSQQQQTYVPNRPPSQVQQQQQQQRSNQQQQQNNFSPSPPQQQQHQQQSFTPSPQQQQRPQQNNNNFSPSPPQQPRPQSQNNFSPSPPQQQRAQEIPLQQQQQQNRQHFNSQPAQQRQQQSQVRPQQILTTLSAVVEAATGAVTQSPPRFQQETIPPQNRRHPGDNSNVRPKQNDLQPNDNNNSNQQRHDSNGQQNYQNQNSASRNNNQPQYQDSSENLNVNFNSNRQRGQSQAQPQQQQYNQGNDYNKGASQNQNQQTRAQSPDPVDVQKQQSQYVPESSPRQQQPQQPTRVQQSQPQQQSFRPQQQQQPQVRPTRPPQQQQSQATQKPFQQDNFQQQQQPINRSPQSTPSRPISPTFQEQSQPQQQQRTNSNFVQEQPKPKPSSAPAQPLFAPPQSKFRHSTPRQHNVKFAPSRQQFSDDGKERQIPQESQQQGFPYSQIYNRNYDALSGKTQSHVGRQQQSLQQQPIIRQPQPTVSQQQLQRSEQTRLPQPQPQSTIPQPQPTVPAQTQSTLAQQLQQVTEAHKVSAAVPQQPQPTVSQVPHRFQHHRQSQPQQQQQQQQQLQQQKPIVNPEVPTGRRVPQAYRSQGALLSFNDPRNGDGENSSTYELAQQANLARLRQLRDRATQREVQFRETQRQTQPKKQQPQQQPQPTSSPAPVTRVETVPTTYRPNPAAVSRIVVKPRLENKFQVHETRTREELTYNRGIVYPAPVEINDEDEAAIHSQYTTGARQYGSKQ